METLECKDLYTTHLNMGICVL